MRPKPDEPREVHFHVHQANLASLERKLDEALTLLRSVLTLEETQVADLSALQAEITENGDVVDSAVTLLTSLSQQLRDALAADDPAALQALADELDANTTALAEAVAANTTPTEEPAP